MGNRLSRIYTRSGDEGSTGLGNGSRLAKDHPRVEAIGTIDELNSALGIVLSHDLPKEMRSALTDIQHRLFDIGGELSLPERHDFPAQPTANLEQWLDDFNAELPALREFILPGGPPPAAACHMARTICRRAERRLVTLNSVDAVNGHVLSYINRLSDLLFVLARALTRQDHGAEPQWRSRRRGGAQEQE
ncbi:MAG: cob(I)yrinic acid a,c-diamide adenosyltransferase [Gammaproteobacteria bacterium]